MKQKNVRKGLSLLLCLSLLSALLLMCSGCGNKDKDALIGTWETTLDLTDMINDELKASMGSDPELLSYFNIDDFSIGFSLTFEDNGNYQLAVDEASLEDSVDKVIVIFRNGIVSYFEKMIEDLKAQGQDIDMSVEEVVEMATGMSLDDFLDDAFDKKDIMSSVDDMESSGTFEVKGGILYLTDDEGTGLEAYKLEGNELTLTGEGVEESDLEGLYPLTFKKK